MTEDRIWLTSQEINDAINKLKKDKSPGRDNITGEHIQYSHPKLSVMLTLMFNWMIQHGYVPEAFMDTLILPIVKYTKEDLGDSDSAIHFILYLTMPNLSSLKSMKMGITCSLPSELII